MKTVQLHINDGGSGKPAIVLLHSLTGSSSHWQAQIDYLRTSHRVLAFDLRGHGLSPAPDDDDFSLAAMAQDVQDGIRQLGVSQFILAGHSMGGAVAMKFAGMFPEMLAGLVLLDAAGDSTQIPREQVQGLLGALASEGFAGVMMGYWQELLVNSAEATSQLVLSTLNSLPQSAIINIFDELTSFNPLPDLAKYTDKLLIVSTPLVESPFALHRLLRDAPHVVVEGTSHWLQLDKPNAVNEILGGFLD